MVVCVVFCKGGSSAYDGYVKARGIQCAEHVSEIYGGTCEQSAQADIVGLVFKRGGEYFSAILVHPDIRDTVAVVFEDDGGKVFSYVVHVAFDRGKKYGSFAAVFSPVEVFQIVHGLFGRFGCSQYKRKLHAVFFKQTAHLFHGGYDHLFYDMRRRVDGCLFFKQWEYFRFSSAYHAFGNGVFVPRAALRGAFTPVCEWRASVYKFSHGGVVPIRVFRKQPFSGFQESGGKIGERHKFFGMYYRSVKPPFDSQFQEE